MTEPIVPEKVTPPATPPVVPQVAPVVPPVVPDKDLEPEVTKVEVKKDGDYVMPDDIDLLDPKKAKEAIEKTVESRLSSLQGDMQTQRINTEIKSIIEAHPEYKPFADKITKWVTHPNRISFIKNGFPVQSVVLEAIAPHLEAIGAEKARLADKKSRESGGDGTTVTAKTVNTKIDFKAMSSKDIEALADKVKSGRA